MTMLSCLEGPASPVMPTREQLQSLPGCALAPPLTSLCNETHLGCHALMPSLAWCMMLPSLSLLWPLMISRDHSGGVVGVGGWWVVGEGHDTP